MAKPMLETVIHIRKGDVVRRLVGPHADEVAERRKAEGWQRFAPPEPFDAEKAAREVRAAEHRTYARMTVAELREELGRRRLLEPDDAKKADLVRTLKEDDAGQTITISTDPESDEGEGEVAGDEATGDEGVA